MHYTKSGATLPVFRLYIQFPFDCRVSEKAESLLFTGTEHRVEVDVLHRSPNSMHDQSEGAQVHTSISRNIERPEGIELGGG